MKRKGLIFVVSAPSGAGKTSLCKEILAAMPGLRHSISYTTRTMRPGEKEGEDYHFVGVEKFKQMISSGCFAEWARVHDNYYGTGLDALKSATESGQDILLDIDCQGAAQLRQSIDNGVYIFILPPGFAELERRLVKRASDPPDVVKKRIENARQEVLEAKWYDYIVINDNFDFAFKQLKAILTAETCRTGLVMPTVKDVFDIQ